MPATAQSVPEMISRFPVTANDHPAEGDLHGPNAGCQRFYSIFKEELARRGDSPLVVMNSARFDAGL